MKLRFPESWVKTLRTIAIIVYTPCCLSQAKWKWMEFDKLCLDPWWEWYLSFPPPRCMGKRLVQEKYVIKIRTPFQLSSSQSQACRVAFIYMWCSSWKKNLHIMFNFFYDRRLQWANANAKRHHCSAWCLDKVSFQPICDWFCLAGCERVKTFLISFQMCSQLFDLLWAFTLRKFTFCFKICKSHMIKAKWVEKNCMPRPTGL